MTDNKLNNININIKYDTNEVDNFHFNRHRVKVNIDNTFLTNIENSFGPFRQKPLYLQEITEDDIIMRKILERKLNLKQ